MGIFSSIKRAIFGEKKEEAPATTTAPSSGGGRGWDPDSTSQAISEVDVEARLDAMDGADRLNWRTSIVDLMKLIGVDSSYENRKELAQELGRTDYSGSAEDNIWLHKQTMQELAKNGGKVPAEFLD
ncbi:DUF3597 domain-containing protein [Altererythrobacter arenosus]|uniref:DUF3597 domain-containing protein n=1 Tax=Altererythrobacter arenosus TaxID=3032592 RepID=A0ABY8FUZ8_9SPHN|nr:DUF3597 domain-containing protein [Altererythrobacter sp. CAU 1644]WFL77915.1 DUF3597 domain-containing protein [Altererythrobacter sp. CAU 1644]